MRLTRGRVTSGQESIRPGGTGFRHPQVNRVFDQHSWPSAIRLAKNASPWSAPVSELNPVSSVAPAGQVT